jgi:hypothetical protein
MAVSRAVDFIATADYVMQYAAGGKFAGSGEIKKPDLLRVGFL